MYEFVGQDSAGLRGGEVQFQVSKFFEPIGMSRRILPWAHIIGTNPVLGWSESEKSPEIVRIFPLQCRERFPSRHTNRLLFPVGLS